MDVKEFAVLLRRFATTGSSSITVVATVNDLCQNQGQYSGSKSR